MNELTLKAVKKKAREIFKDMPRGKRHGTKKGKKGYTRKEKHKAGAADENR